jgi:hypothetical protein
MAFIRLIHLYSLRSPSFCSWFRQSPVMFLLGGPPSSTPLWPYAKAERACSSKWNRLKVIAEAIHAYFTDNQSWHPPAAISHYDALDTTYEYEPRCTKVPAFSWVCARYLAHSRPETVKDLEFLVLH